MFNKSGAHSTTHFTLLTFALLGLKCDLPHRSESGAGLDSTCRSWMGAALIENGMYGVGRSQIENSRELLQSLCKTLSWIPNLIIY